MLAFYQALNGEAQNECLEIMATGETLGGDKVDSFVALMDAFEKFRELQPLLYPDIPTFMAMKAEGQKSLQSKLTEHVATVRHVAFIAKLIGPLVHHGGWFTSLQHPDAGRWLTVCPRIAEYKFNNAQYVNVLQGMPLRF